MPREVAEIYIPGDFKNLTGTDPEQLAHIDPALSRGIVPDGLQWSFPTSAVL